MVVRATLQAREHFRKYLLSQLFAAYNHGSPGAAQGFMGSSSYHIRMRERAWMHLSHYQPRNMGNIAHKVSARLLGNFPKCGKVDCPGIRAIPCYDELGLFLCR